METRQKFDLKDDWNYIPSTQEAREGEKKRPTALPKSELTGLKYDDLRGLSWTIMEEYDYNVV